MRKYRVAMVALVALAGAVPAPAAAAPRLETQLVRLDSAWEHDPDGLRRYPRMIAFDGHARVHADAPGVFPSTTWADARLVRLSDVSPDVAPDAVARAALRLAARPVKLRLLQDAGVDRTVREVALGTEVRFVQGVSPDLHLSAAAVAGSDASDGNVVEQFVLAAGGEIVFPPRAPSGTEGTFAWERAMSVRGPTSTANDPTAAGGTLSGQIVAVTDVPSLRVDGGDITRTTAAPPLRFELPDDVRPIGALAVSPAGLTGVDLEIAWKQLTSGDLRRTDLMVTANPSRPWPQSAVSGPLREWMFRSRAMLYGARSSEGAGAAAIIDAPIPPGHEVLTMTIDGTQKRLGPLSVPGHLHIENVEGMQKATLTPLAAPPAPPSRASASATQAAPASRAATSALRATASDEQAEGLELRSPALRDVIPPGAARARLLDRNGVPVVAGLTVGDTLLGDIAVPAIRVDGVVTPLTRARLVRPPAVLPFGVGDPGLGLDATGFDVFMLAEVPGAMVELLWQITHVRLRGTVYDDANLYVLSVHSTDKRSHTVEVDWYSRPDADSLFAADVKIPAEVVTENQATSLVLHADSETGQQLDYYNGAPHAAHSSEASGARGLYVLVRDPAGPSADPLAEVNGESLARPAAVYVRQVIEGPGNASSYPRGWLTIRRHVSEPLI